MRSDLTRSILLTVLVFGLVSLTVVPVWDPIWWATNEDPPDLVINGDFGPLRGVAEAEVNVDPVGRASIVSATVDGRPAKLSGSKVIVDTTQLPDGVHQVTVFVRDRSLHANENAATWVFLSINKPSNLSVNLDPGDGPVEGSTSVVHASTDRAAVSVRGTVDGSPLHFEPDGRGGFWSLLAAPLDQGRRELSYHIEAADEAGNPASLDGSWVVQPSRVGSPAATPDVRIDAAEHARVHAVLAVTDTPKQWDGRFKVPVDAPSKSRGTPPGLDFAAAQGSPISASADGMVLLVDGGGLAESTLVVDHGAGVATMYQGDMNNVDVVPGQNVKASQIIGRVGPSGQVYWELTVRGVEVDPLAWTQRTFP